MTENELFEADYLAAFPESKSDLRKDGCGCYTHSAALLAQTLWLQQQKRHEEEVTELVTLLKDLDACYCEAGPGMDRQQRYVARTVLTNCRAAIAKFDAPKEKS